MRPQQSTQGSAAQGWMHRTSWLVLRDVPDQERSCWGDTECLERVLATSGQW